MAELVVSMDVRMAIAFFEQTRPRGSVTKFCADAGISRETFYVYQRRFRAGGLEGLVPGSRRPLHSPSATPPAMMELVIGKRLWLLGEGLDAGALSIRYWLLREDRTPPSARTIHRILCAHGLVEPQPKKRPRSSFKRFEFPDPNACWQMDGMKWKLADHTEVVVLRLLDDHSRAGMASLACERENTHNAWAVMETAMERHGRPAMFLSDGGTAFTQRRTHTPGLGEFEARLRHVGILPVVSSSAHPQTCGKKEREWQTQQRWLRARPPAQNLAELQRQLDAYDLIYNHQRPHQALGGATPHERYLARPKATAADRPLATPMTTRTVKIDRQGCVNLGNGQSTSIGTQWAYSTVTVLREDPAAAIFHDDQLLRFLHIDPDRKYQKRAKR